MCEGQKAWASFHNLKNFTKKSDPLDCCQDGSEKVSELDGKTFKKEALCYCQVFSVPSFTTC